MKTAYALLLANPSLPPEKQLFTGPLCKSVECRDRSANPLGGCLVVGTVAATVHLEESAKSLAEGGPLTLQLHGAVHVSRVADVMQRGRRVGVAVDVQFEAFDEAERVPEIRYSLRVGDAARAELVEA